MEAPEKDGTAKKANPNPKREVIDLTNETETRWVLRKPKPKPAKQRSSTLAGGFSAREAIVLDSDDELPPVKVVNTKKSTTAVGSTKKSTAAKTSSVAGPSQKTSQSTPKKTLGTCAEPVEIASSPPRNRTVATTATTSSSAKISTPGTAKSSSPVSKETDAKITTRNNFITSEPTSTDMPIRQGSLTVAPSRASPQGNKAPTHSKNGPFVDDTIKPTAAANTEKQSSAVATPQASAQGEKPPANDKVNISAPGTDKPAAAGTEKPTPTLFGIFSRSLPGPAQPMGVSRVTSENPRPSKTSKVADPSIERNHTKTNGTMKNIADAPTTPSLTSTSRSGLDKNNGPTLKGPSSSKSPSTAARVAKIMKTSGAVASAPEVAVKSIETAVFKPPEQPKGPKNTHQSQKKTTELRSDPRSTVSPGMATSTSSQSSSSSSSSSSIAPRSRPVSAVSDALSNFNTPLATMKECLAKHLQVIYERHDYLSMALMKRNREALEREARAKERSQGLTSTSTGAERWIQKKSPFKKMKPSEVTLKIGRREPYFLEEFIDKPRPKDGIKIAVNPTYFESTAVEIPAFQEYVSLQDNILSENVNKLLHMPYFDNDQVTAKVVNKGLWKELSKDYKMREDDDSHLMDDVNRFYSPAAKAFLSDMGVEWEDILFWILAPDADIVRINGRDDDGWGKYLLDREPHLVENFDRKALKWRSMFPSLPTPSRDRLRLAALACTTFLKQTTFTLWHLARRSEFVQKEISQNLQGTTVDLKFSYETAACRVCHTHNCQTHGEFRENPEKYDEEHAAGQGDSQSVYAGSDDKSEEDAKETAEVEESDNDLDENSDVDEIINYRRAINVHAFPAGNAPTGHFHKPPPGPFKPEWWIQKTNTARWDFRAPFYPCHHPGMVCVTAECRCYREGITCEKSCKCSESCNRRFPGCSCANHENGGAGEESVCGSKGSKCLCVMLNRECDADLCGSCGASCILDPVNHYKNYSQSCTNVMMQRGVPKKTLLGTSQVHGFGLYIGEDVMKDEFIGEYKGEIITVGESCRRSHIYEEKKTMYLFRLNREQEIDATHFGNKLRFINNSDPKYANCYVKNLLCNTVQRIGLYANKNLKVGTELFFHYGYSEEQTKNFKQPDSIGSSSSSSSNNNKILPPGTAVAVKQKAGHSSKDSTRSAVLPAPINTDMARKSASTSIAKKSAGKYNPRTTLRERIATPSTATNLREDEIPESEPELELDEDEDEEENAHRAKRHKPGGSSSSVVALKQKEERKRTTVRMTWGGAREGSGRKRKRATDDDEE